MIIELASLPPMVQAYIKSEQQVQLIVKEGQVHLMPLYQPKQASNPKSNAERLGMSVADLAKVDDVVFEPNQLA